MGSTSVATYALSANLSKNGLSTSSFNNQSSIIIHADGSGNTLASNLAASIIIPCTVSDQLSLSYTALIDGGEGFLQSSIDAAQISVIQVSD